MKRLENDTHFVDLRAEGNRVVVRSAPHGGKPRASITDHENQVVARRALHDFEQQYLREGYRVVHVPIAAQPRHPELEAAIRIDRNDPGPYHVYADWLQGQGSAIGELIVLDQAEQVAAADAIRGELGLPDEDVATMEWRWGLWRSLHINHADHQNAALDVLGIARDLFGSTLCGVLDELRIGMQRWDHNHTDVPAILAEAARHAWARDLRTLRVGDVDRDIDMAHHAIGQVGATISAAFPRLVELRLHSGDQGWRGVGETFGVGGLDLPALRILIVETCALTRARLAALLDARLPAMHRLELWFGSANQDADADVDALEPLLSGQRHAGVTVLGLRNCEFADALAAALPESAIAARLHRLDLSMGTLGDAGAEALASARDRFPALDELVVDDNFLTGAGLALLTKAFPHVISHGQKQPFDGDERYVTVGE